MDSVRHARFLDVLRSGHVLLMDGAMGTQLQRHGAREGECYELRNIDHPHVVQAIHRSYVTVGAEVLLTNTFQANPITLKKHGLMERGPELIRAGVELASKTAGEKGFVLGDLGPYDPDEPLTKELQQAFVAAMNAFSNTDGLLAETFVDPRGLLAYCSSMPL